MWTVDEAVQELNKLKNSIAAAHNLCLPINKLPVELLSEIMKYACTCPRSRELNMEWDWRVSETQHERASIIRTCSYWYRLAISTPSLWSTIALVSGSDSQQLSLSQIELFRREIFLSQTHNLEVEVGCSTLVVHPNVYFDSLRFLHENHYRIESLKINLGYQGRSTYIGTVCAIFTQCRSKPRLRQVRISGSLFLGDNIVLSSAPHLSQIWIGKIDTSFPWSIHLPAACKITHLTLDLWRKGLTDIARVLESCPLLEYLSYDLGINNAVEVSSPSSSLSLSPLSSAVVLLSHLHTLKLKGSAVACFHFLDTPYLERLWIGPLNFEVQEESIPVSISPRVFPLLRNLYTDIDSWDNGGFHRFVQGHRLTLEQLVVLEPCTTTIEETSTPWVIGLVESLVRMDEYGEYHFPMFRTLELSSRCTRKLSWVNNDYILNNFFDNIIPTPFMIYAKFERDEASNEGDWLSVLAQKSPELIRVETVIDKIENRDMWWASFQYGP